MYLGTFFHAGLMRPRGERIVKRKCLFLPDSLWKLNSTDYHRSFRSFGKFASFLFLLLGSTTRLDFILLLHTSHRFGTS